MRQHFYFEDSITGHSLAIRHRRKQKILVSKQAKRLPKISICEVLPVKKKDKRGHQSLSEIPPIANPVLASRTPTIKKLPLPLSPLPTVD